MKVIFTISGRCQWYVSETGGSVIQITADVAQRYMDDGVLLELR